MLELFALTVFSGFIILGLATFWGEMGDYYGTSPANDTLGNLNKMEETIAQYEQLKKTFISQQSAGFIESAVNLIATGIWTVVKQLINSVDFLIGSNGLVSEVLGYLPFPAWFELGIIGLVGMALFFFVIGKGTG